MIRAHIVGVGAYLPARVLSNHDLEKLVDTSDEWIRTRTGIRERRIADENEHTSDLAVAAAREALEDAGLSVGELDALIVATTTPDMIFPSTASIVQEKLGGQGFPAWDVQAVCAGFVYALAHADAWIRAGFGRRVLVVGAETMSRIVNWRDRSTCVLFGDGAGAVVLEGREEEGGIIGSVLHCDGRYRPLLLAHHGRRVGHPDKPVMDVDSAGVAAIQMRGNEVFRVAVQKLGEVVEEVLARFHVRAEDVDWLVPHQANLRIIRATASRLRLPMERVAVTIDRHGNTSAASVPLALHALARSGRLKPGQLLLFEAFASGFAWGANLVRWTKEGR
ncbi:MAG: ketoacyl-ACP synthase III [Zetaproteobacteria bacterium]|nr:MAG: ketoacyl-ACP synthase III [Zetaproteobacteria bacterium]